MHLTATNIIPVLATKINSTTLVGIGGCYPLKAGNCFSVIAENKVYKILNFIYENLIHLINNNIIDFPIKIHLLDEKHAIIIDEKIPDDYFADNFCTTCSPYKLLPITQQIKYWRDVERGLIKEVKKDDMILIIKTIKPKPQI
jgi:hypothetical protein